MINIFLKLKKTFRLVAQRLNPPLSTQNNTVQHHYGKAHLVLQFYYSNQIFRPQNEDWTNNLQIHSCPRPSGGGVSQKNSYKRLGFFRRGGDQLQRPQLAGAWHARVRFLGSKIGGGQPVDAGVKCFTALKSNPSNSHHSANPVFSATDSGSPPRRAPKYSSAERFLWCSNSCAGRRKVCGRWH